MKKFNYLYYVWGFIVVIVFALLCALGFSFKNHLKDYHKFENDLITSVKNYLYDNELYSDIKDFKKVTVKFLIDNKYLNKNAVPNSCKGYILVSRSNDDFIYEPKIECKYYKSK